MSDQFAFEEITEAELIAEARTTTSGRRKNPKYDDTIRTQTAWHKLPHIMGFCTVPTHDELQQLICEASDEARQYREQLYPNRMTYLIDPYHVCRDCYCASADIECRAKELPPLELSDPHAS
jgi:hypothetical protein